MKLLLDTHILIWAAAGTLPQEAVPFIANAGNVLLFSPASIWETVIKKGIGRADFQIDPFALYRGLLDSMYIELAITSRHVLAVGSLPYMHKYPFDRLLIAQSRVEGITLLTADATVAQYKDVIIFIRGGV
jgi:PIN domain nuclease of toxin-antitoxin system